MDYKVKAVKHDGAVASKSRARITSSSRHRPWRNIRRTPTTLAACGLWWTRRFTVPRLVLARIDEFAKKKGQSRSGCLVEAARTAMHA
jgi:hypothetical protein